MARLTPAERRERKRKLDNINAARRNWETRFRPHILHLLNDSRAGHYAAFILVCCSAEQAYHAVKDYAVDSEESLMRRALKFAMKHWAENGGLADPQQWPSAERQIDAEFMLILNKVKHCWRLPEGYQLNHGLADNFIRSGKVDTDIVGVSESGWVLREVVPNSKKWILNALKLCNMLIQGIDAVYTEALSELDDNSTM